MKFPICVACGSRDDLQHHHLVTRDEGGGDDDTNLITLCHSCHAKLHERQINGVYSASENIRDAKRHLAAQGISSGGSRPFGFDVVLDGKIKRLVPNAAETEIIERMKTMRRDGATYRAIGAVTGHGPKSVQRILERMVRTK
jgi:hypothetical protein